MADILMGALRAGATMLASTEGENKIVKVVDFVVNPNDKTTDLIDPNSEANQNNGANLTIGERINSWWNKLVELGNTTINWLQFFPPMFYAKQALGMLFRVCGDNIETIYNFNWNITDEELDAGWKSSIDNLYGQVGGTLGNLAGSMLVTGTTAAVFWGVERMLKFNDGMAVKILKEGGEEALDELWDNLRGICGTVRNMAVSAIFVNTFKSARRITKWFLQNPDSPQTRFLNALYGEQFIKAIKESGEKGTKPWSFAIAKEAEYDAIAKKDGQKWANFWEEYDEEFREGMQNAFYINANVVEQQAIEPDLILGATRAVEVYPNRNNKTEKIILSGNEQLLKPMIIEAIQSHKQFENKNVGMIIGESLETKIAELRGIDTKQCDLLIRYHDEKEPPFSRKGKKAVDYLIRVPDVDRSKLDEWQLIKTLAGGKSGYLGGGIKVVAHLGKADGLESDTIEVMAGSEDAGMDLIESLLKLTDLKVLWYSPITQSKRGTRGHYRYQKPTQVHPAFMTVVNYERIIKEQEGKKPPSGTYKKDKYLIPLWVDTQPQGYKQIITELLMTNG